MMANSIPLLLLMLLEAAAAAAADGTSTYTTCGDLKKLYQDESCCGNAGQQVEFQVVPKPTMKNRVGMDGSPIAIPSNPCAGKKNLTIPGMNNVDCSKAMEDSFEQSGADVSLGFQGTIVASVAPITKPYFKTTLCPVNVHWHLGAEHRSEGEFDESGTSPEHAGDFVGDGGGRRLADNARYGFACKHYTPTDDRFITNYTWRHCKNMHVGATYEVHWPHSALGACGTPYQYQYPFYDGVFCGATTELLGTLTEQDIASSVGVQGQVFTIINDESYYYPDLARGMIVDGEYGKHITVYSGSTTGTTRDNKQCSAYTPITWQVDRKCHLISASSFDKMCADMKQMRDDMTKDLQPHGARELVWANLTANNQKWFSAWKEVDGNGNLKDGQ